MFRRMSWLWLAVVTWWTVYGVVLAIETMTMQASPARTTELSLGFMFRASLCSAWLWIPLTVGLILLARHHPIERGRIVAPLALHVLAVAAIIVLRAAMVYALNGWVGWYTELPAFSNVLTSNLAKNFLIAWLIVGVAHGLLYHERASARERQAMELETRLARARLEALSAQLNPHFLFNALNSVSELVHRNPEAADRMLVSLGKLLRANLDSSSIQEVPLHEEISLLEHYVEFEKMRLEDRLRMHWEIDRTLLPMHVPRLVLQPLVENAIRHALGKRMTPGKVVVSVRRRPDERAVLEVRDDGRTQAAPLGKGIGLSNTRARLCALYGDDHEFELVRTEADDGTVARVVLPIRMLEDAA